MENGTPQGSILSPLLFIIILNGLPNPVGNIRVSMYADDIALWTMGTDRSQNSPSTPTSSSRPFSYPSLSTFVLVSTDEVHKLIRSSRLFIYPYSKTILYPYILFCKAR
ncbi:reverse transcriptase domain-containing protein [Staphylococcus aureus]